MNKLVRFFEWFYAQSLKLYPSSFRDKFGDEMQAVFKIKLLEAKKAHWSQMLVHFGYEIREWPSSMLCEHWYAWTQKEAIVLTNYKRPDWFFYPSWVGVSILAFALSFFAYFPVIGLVTRWVGDTIYVNGVRHITEDYLFLYIFFPTLCLLSGILQYGLLRRYVPKMGWWILATMAGCLLVFATMIFLIRIFDMAFLNLWNGTLAFATIGGLIGLSQWIFLRRRIPKAGWWILASILGWSLAVLGSLTEVRNGSALAQLLAFSLSPAIIAGFAWWYLLKPEAQQENPLSR